MSSEAVPQTFDAELFSSLPIRFGQSGIAELYSAKIRENPKMPSTTRRSQEKRSASTKRIDTIEQPNM